jgi:hypothetical protein
MSEPPNGADLGERTRRVLRAQRVRVTHESPQAAQPAKKLRWRIVAATAALCVSAVGVAWLNAPALLDAPALRSNSVPAAALPASTPMEASSTTPAPPAMPSITMMQPVESAAAIVSGPATIETLRVPPEKSRASVLSAGLESIGIRIRVIDLDVDLPDAASRTRGQGLLVINAVNVDAEGVRVGDVILGECDSGSTQSARELLQQMEARRLPCLNVVRNAQVQMLIANHDAP